MFKEHIVCPMLSQDISIQIYLHYSHFQDNWPKRYWGHYLDLSR